MDSSSSSSLPPPPTTGGASVDMNELTVEQATLLLHSLDLEDYAQAFAIAKISGRKLNQCSTREELKEDWDIDMSKCHFLTLRAAVEEYTPSGVPTTLLDEAREKVQQRESAPASTPAPSSAPAPAPTLAPARVISSIPTTTQEKFATAKWYIEGGCDLEARVLLDRAVVLESFGNKWTLLHLAASKGRLALIDPLVEMGAVVDVQTQQGMTPLWFACYHRLRGSGHRDVALRLLHHGADPTIKDCDGWDAIKVAREKGSRAFVDELEAARQKYLDSQEIMLK